MALPRAWVREEPVENGEEVVNKDADDEGKAERKAVAHRVRGARNSKGANSIAVAVVMVVKQEGRIYWDRAEEVEHAMAAFLLALRLLEPPAGPLDCIN